MAELVRTLSESDRPLCPRSMAMPANTAHALAVQFQDTVYDALKPFRDDETDEQGNASGRAVEEAMRGNRVTDRMWLMRHTTRIPDEGRDIETYWWECRLCGLILPCTAVSHGP